ncbi:MAG: hypothetical protein ACJ72X_16665, partial [Nitrososphaeraceae archaeon]
SLLNEICAFFFFLPRTYFVPYFWLAKNENTHLVKLELLSNATTIDNALNYIRNRQQRKQQEENIKIDTITTSTTRNQVF